MQDAAAARARGRPGPGAALPQRLLLRRQDGLAPQARARPRAAAPRSPSQACRCTSAFEQERACTRATRQHGTATHAPLRHGCRPAEVWPQRTGAQDEPVGCCAAPWCMWPPVKGSPHVAQGRERGGARRGGPARGRGRGGRGPPALGAGRCSLLHHTPRPGAGPGRDRIAAEAPGAGGHRAHACQWHEGGGAVSLVWSHACGGPEHGCSH